MVGESWRIGEVTITHIAKILLTADSRIMSRLTPDANAQNLKELPWFAPHFASPTAGRLQLDEGRYRFNA